MEAVVKPWSKTFREFFEIQQNLHEATMTEIAQCLNRPRRSVYDLLEKPSREFLEEVGALFGIPADKLIRQYLEGEDDSRRQHLKHLKQIGRIARTFPRRDLQKVGVLRKKVGLVDSCAEILEALGIGSAEEIDSTRTVDCLASSEQRKTSAKGLNWVLACAEKVIERENVSLPSFDSEELEKLASDLILYPANGRLGFDAVARNLAEAGVHLIVLPKFPHLGARGVSYKRNDQYVILLFEKEYWDTVWFALAHEIGHLILHRDVLEQTRVHVTEGERFSLVEESEVENEANSFAVEALLRDIDLEEFRGYSFNVKSIAARAKDVGIEPSIVFGRLAWEMDEYWRFNPFRKTFKREMKWSTSWIGMTTELSSA